MRSLPFLRRGLAALAAVVLVATLAPAAPGAVPASAAVSASTSAPTAASESSAVAADVSASAVIPAKFTDTLVADVPSPTALAFALDGRALVASRGGPIRIVENGVLLPTPAIDLRAKICANGERGVLGLAVDPDPTTRAVFVFYTARGSDAACPTNANGTKMPTGAPRNRVSRFVLGDDDRIDPASETILLDGIYSPAGYHNAGDLAVGKDGLLYVSIGDGGCDYRGGVGSTGGSGCGGKNDAARDRNILNGKIARITTSGGVPASNPFLGTGTASCRLAPAASGTVCREIFAQGLRNPFRMAFDPNATGTVFRINDVGQDAWEEIDAGIKGADYGWNTREGHCAQTGSPTNCGAAKPAAYTDPVFDYSHADGCASITGGAFVPNGVWPAAYTGAYLFGDYVCGKIRTLSPGGTATDLVSGLGTSSAVALAFGPSRGTQDLFYTTYANGGQLRRLAYTGTANRAPTAVLTASPASGSAPLAVTLKGAGSSDPDGGALAYLWSFGDGTASKTTTASSSTHTYARGDWTATLRVRDSAGALSAPVTQRISSGNRAPTVSITSPAAGATFTSGTTYRLRATATDPEDGTLPASSLSWTVQRRHAEHTHPFFGPVTGNDVPFTAPGPEDLAAAGNSDLLVTVTATDSKGLVQTSTRVFAPKKVSVTIATSPAGRTVLVNGTPFTGPATVVSWAGSPLQLEVPAQSTASGTPYVFSRWSDGGAAAHSITTPGAAVTYTATLRPAVLAGPPTAVTATASASGTAVLSWAPPSGGPTVTGYRVSRDGVDGSGAGPWAAVVASTKRSQTFTNLVPGRTYRLSVQAVTADGAGAVAGATVLAK
ncbi:beta-glucosidase [Rathayibacter caricis DSM 15933]|uniref:Beta-glucosidase n=1 Tax=Rathayibacter caricis DSM 15933 TaxID=1328867 RepID=A0A2T4UR05_9MICO|nr:PQQ-dependent sugar dehydrogenase [Rathayibacter caricis]PTL71954.1 beta-glucosidase [Rathayibacter caricis DSM 15933]